MDEPRAAAWSVEPRGKVAKRLGPHVVVRPQPLALGVDDARVAQLFEVVAEGGLTDVEERQKLVDDVCLRRDGQTARAVPFAVVAAIGGLVFVAAVAAGSIIMTNK